MIHTMTITMALALVSSGVGALDNAQDQFQAAKERVVATDLAEREILGNLYTINKRMKDMSRKRDRITDHVLAAETDVKRLSKQADILAQRAEMQRNDLRLRLRDLYLINDQGVLRGLFSSSSSLDLDRQLKFLKKVTDHDYHLIKEYEISLAALGRKRRDLDSKVKRLTHLQTDLKHQESRLIKEQNGKAELLSQLKDRRESHLSEMKRLRKQQYKFDSSVMDLAFFENKGQLMRPIKGDLLKGFGVVQDETYRYVLAHKGEFYSSEKSDQVLAVFKGLVAFAGEMQGYGQVVILDHGDHYYTLYGQLMQMKVQSGELVPAGQWIGSAGGRSPWFGAGLYFEIRHFSEAIDPQPWFRDHQMKTSQL